MRATALLCPRSPSSLASLWSVGTQVVRVHERPQEVPLRAVTALLESVGAVRAGATKRSIQGSAGTLLKVARTRLLHGRRRVAPLQVRRFVAALRAAAPHIAVRDGGLLAAVLREAAGVPAIATAKRRGRAGAERFVRTFEDIAALQDYGVVFSMQRSHALEGASAGMADETLALRLDSVLADVETACADAAAARSTDADVARLGQDERLGPDSASGLDDDEGGDDEWEAQIETDATSTERLDYSLEGRVGRMPWKGTAWDDTLTLRLQTALSTILGR